MTGDGSFFPDPPSSSCHNTKSILNHHPVLEFNGNKNDFWLLFDDNDIKEKYQSRPLRKTANPSTALPSTSKPGFSNTFTVVTPKSGFLRPKADDDEPSQLKGNVSSSDRSKGAVGEKRRSRSPERRRRSRSPDSRRSPGRDGRYGDKRDRHTERRRSRSRGARGRDRSRSRDRRDRDFRRSSPSSRRRYGRSRRSSSSSSGSSRGSKDKGNKAVDANILKTFALRLQEKSSKSTNKSLSSVRLNSRLEDTRHRRAEAVTPIVFSLKKPPPKSGLAASQSQVKDKPTVDIQLPKEKLSEPLEVSEPSSKLLSSDGKVHSQTTTVPPLRLVQPPVSQASPALISYSQPVSQVPPLVIPPPVSQQVQPSRVTDGITVACAPTLYKGGKAVPITPSLISLPSPSQPPQAQPLPVPPPAASHPMEVPNINEMHQNLAAQAFEYAAMSQVQDHVMPGQVMQNMGMPPAGFGHMMGCPPGPPPGLPRPGFGIRPGMMGPGNFGPPGQYMGPPPNMPDRPFMGFPPHGPDGPFMGHPPYRPDGPFMGPPPYRPDGPFMGPPPYRPDGPFMGPPPYGPDGPFMGPPPLGSDGQYLGPPGPGLSTPVFEPQDGTRRSHVPRNIITISSSDSNTNNTAPLQPTKMLETSSSSLTASTVGNFKSAAYAPNISKPSSSCANIVKSDEMTSDKPAIHSLKIQNFEKIGFVVRLIKFLQNKSELKKHITSLEKSPSDKYCIKNSLLCTVRKGSDGDVLVILVPEDENSRKTIVTAFVLKYRKMDVDALIELFEQSFNCMPMEDIEDVFENKSTRKSTLLKSINSDFSEVESISPCGTVVLRGISSKKSDETVKMESTSASSSCEIRAMDKDAKEVSEDKTNKSITDSSIDTGKTVPREESLASAKDPLRASGAPTTEIKNEQEEPSVSKESIHPIPSEELKSTSAQVGPSILASEIVEKNIEAQAKCEATSEILEECSDKVDKSTFAPSSCEIKVKEEDAMEVSDDITDSSLETGKTLSREPLASIQEPVNATGGPAVEIKKVPEEPAASKESLHPVPSEELKGTSAQVGSPNVAAVDPVSATAAPTSEMKREPEEPSASEESLHLVPSEGLKSTFGQGDSAILTTSKTVDTHIESLVKSEVASEQYPDKIDTSTKSENILVKTDSTPNEETSAHTEMSVEHTTQKPTPPANINNTSRESVVMGAFQALKEDDHLKPTDEKVTETTNDPNAINEPEIETLSSPRVEGISKETDTLTGPVEATTKSGDCISKRMETSSGSGAASSVDEASNNDDCITKKHVEPMEEVIKKEPMEVVEDASKVIETSSRSDEALPDVVEATKTDGSIIKNIEPVAEAVKDEPMDVDEVFPSIVPVSVNEKVTQPESLTASDDALTGNSSFEKKTEVEATEHEGMNNQLKAIECVSLTDTAVELVDKKPSNVESRIQNVPLVGNSVVEVETVGSDGPKLISETSGSSHSVSSTSEEKCKGELTVVEAGVSLEETMQDDKDSLQSTIEDMKKLSSKTVETVLNVVTPDIKLEEQESASTMVSHVKDKLIIPDVKPVELEVPQTESEQNTEDPVQVTASTHDTLSSSIPATVPVDVITSEGVEPSSTPPETKAPPDVKPVNQQSLVVQTKPPRQEFSKFKSTYELMKSMEFDNLQELYTEPDNLNIFNYDQLSFFAPRLKEIQKASDIASLTKVLMLTPYDVTDQFVMKSGLLCKRKDLERNEVFIVLLKTTAVYREIVSALTEEYPELEFNEFMSLIDKSFSYTTADEIKSLTETMDKIVKYQNFIERCNIVNFGIIEPMLEQLRTVQKADRAIQHRYNRLKLNGGVDDSYIIKRGIVCQFVGTSNLKVSLPTSEADQIAIMYIVHETCHNKDLVKFLELLRATFEGVNAYLMYKATALCSICHPPATAFASSLNKACEQRCHALKALPPEVIFKMRQIQMASSVFKAQIDLLTKGQSRQGSRYILDSSLLCKAMTKGDEQVFRVVISPSGLKEVVSLLHTTYHRKQLDEFVSFVNEFLVVTKEVCRYTFEECFMCNQNKLSKVVTAKKSSPFKTGTKEPPEEETKGSNKGSSKVCSGQDTSKPSSTKQEAATTYKTAETSKPIWEPREKATEPPKTVRGDRIKKSIIRDLRGLGSILGRELGDRVKSILRLVPDRVLEDVASRQSTCTELLKTIKDLKKSKPTKNDNEILCGDILLVLKSKNAIKIKPKIAVKPIKNINYHLITGIHSEVHDWSLNKIHTTIGMAFDVTPSKYEVAKMIDWFCIKCMTPETKQKKKICCALDEQINNFYSMLGKEGKSIDTKEDEGDRIQDGGILKAVSEDLKKLGEVWGKELGEKIGPIAHPIPNTVLKAVIDAQRECPQLTGIIEELNGATPVKDARYALCGGILFIIKSKKRALWVKIHVKPIDNINYILITKLHEACHDWNVNRLQATIGSSFDVSPSTEETAVTIEWFCEHCQKPDTTSKKKKTAASLKEQLEDLNSTIDPSMLKSNDDELEGTVDFTQEVDVTDVRAALAKLPNPVVHKLQLAQMQSNVLKTKVKLLETVDSSEKMKGYCLVMSLLCKVVQLDDKLVWRIIIPSDIVKDLVTQLHTEFYHEMIQEDLDEFLSDFLVVPKGLIDEVYASCALCLTTVRRAPTLCELGINEDIPRKMLASIAEMIDYVIKWQTECPAMAKIRLGVKRARKECTAEHLLYKDVLFKLFAKAKGGKGPRPKIAVSLLPNAKDEVIRSTHAFYHSNNPNQLMNLINTTFDVTVTRNLLITKIPELCNICRKKTENARDSSADATLVTVKEEINREAQSRSVIASPSSSGDLPDEIKTEGEQPPSLGVLLLGRLCDQVIEESSNSSRALDSPVPDVASIDAPPADSNPVIRQTCKVLLKRCKYDPDIVQLDDGTADRGKKGKQARKVKPKASEEVEDSDSDAPISKRKFVVYSSDSETDNCPPKKPKATTSSTKKSKKSHK